MKITLLNLLKYHDKIIGKLKFLNLKVDEINTYLVS